MLGRLAVPKTLEIICKMHRKSPRAPPMANGLLTPRGFCLELAGVIPRLLQDQFSPPVECLSKLGGRFGYFLFFFCLGEGKGEPEAPGRGGGG